MLVTENLVHSIFLTMNFISVYIPKYTRVLGMNGRIKIMVGGRNINSARGNQRMQNVMDLGPLRA